MENCIKQLKAYIKQLSDLGYHDFQINSIIEDAVGTSNLRKLRIEQVNDVTETLAEHLKFALKCRHQG